MSPSANDLLRHILDEIGYLTQQAATVDKAELLADDTLRRAFARSIEIIGEAAKQMPADTRNAHPAIPWKAVAGMRDRLIHGYFSVDYDIVWDVVQNKLPELRPQIKQLLEELES